MKVKGTLALFIFALCLSTQSARAAGKPHVLMVYIDGMRPDYVTAADEHHLKIPTLRSFLHGTYADGVINSSPANTYPNHTTLVTGVSPSVHGIYNNLLFDPIGQHPGDWYWYAMYVKVPTLWQAASKAGLKTASIGWPVTNGATGIDYLITEFAQSEDGAELKSQEVDKPENLRNTLAPELVASDADGDVKKVAWAIALMKRENPNFFTVHINDLDHIEHATGVFSDDDCKTLETIDSQLKQLIDTELALDPNAVIVVVSDHGFANIDTRINLGVLFVKAGLVPIAKKGDPPLPPDTPWQATVWDGGGTAAIMLRDPNDQAVLAKVSALLQDAAKNPDYGIARILTRDQVLKIGGYPDASFVVEFKPGFASAKSFTGKVVVAAPGHGQHGYLADRPEMHSSFFMIGKGVAHDRDLGIVDMRQIAPTVAQVLGVPFPSAALQPLHYRP